MIAAADRYVLATQRPWGRDVFDRVATDGEPWACRFVEGRDTHPETLLDLLIDFDPAYVFYVHWSEKVPAEIFERWECVNLHCTRLPFGRGGHPIENLLLRGYRETVLTAHRMVEDVDAGPIYGVSEQIRIGSRVRVPTFNGSVDTDPDSPRYGQPTFGQVVRNQTKDEILRSFIAPASTLIRRIVDERTTPRPQVGAPTRFSRLPQPVYEKFWNEWTNL